MCASGPHTRSAIPCRDMKTPTVMMISVSGLENLAGWMVNRSTSNPMMVVTPIERMTLMMRRSAIGSGISIS